MLVLLPLPIACDAINQAVGCPCAIRPHNQRPPTNADGPDVANVVRDKRHGIRARDASGGMRGDQQAGAERNKEGADRCFASMFAGKSERLQRPSSASACSSQPDKLSRRIGRLYRANQCRREQAWSKSQPSLPLIYARAWFTRPRRRRSTGPVRDRATSGASALHGPKTGTAMARKRAQV